MSTKEGFDGSRTDYIQALLQGDAALNQYLDPLHERVMPTSPQTEKMTLLKGTSILILRTILLSPFFLQWA